MTFFCARIPAKVKLEPETAPSDAECVVAIRAALQATDATGGRVKWWDTYPIIDTHVVAYRAGFAAGLAAIPREPTQAMMLAGLDVQDKQEGTDTAGVWRAMYDAAQGGKPE